MSEKATEKQDRNRGTEQLRNPEVLSRAFQKILQLRGDTRNKIKTPTKLSELRLGMVF